jgi:type IV pilus assembly protein PilW
VLAVRVSLLAVATIAQQTNTTIQPYLYNGATVTPTDRRMRKVFTTTIGIRNRS